MYVRAELGLAGARQAGARGDVLVMVDALRSSVTITAALAIGVQKVIPVRDVGEARTFLGRPGFFVAGEREGIQVPDFDLGNSPSQVLQHAAQLTGQTMILITSNGTPCIWAARGVRALLAGSLPNARAVVDAAFRLAEERGCDITLLAAGEAGGPAVEDDYAVAVLAGQLGARGARSEASQPSTPPGGVFRDAANGRKLTRLGYAADVALCARMNVFQVAGLFREGGFVPWKTG